MTRSVVPQQLRQFLTGAAEDAALTPLTGLDLDALLDVAAALDEASERLQALRSAVLRQADLAAAGRERLVERVHLQATQGVREIRVQVRQAKLLEGFPLFAEAWQHGAISQAQLRGMFRGLARIPFRLGPVQLEEAQQELLDLAARFDPPALEKLAETLAKELDPEAADQAAAKQQERAAKAAAHNRGVWFTTDTYNGTVHFRGELPIGAGQLFQDQLTALLPSRESYKTAGLPVPTVQGRRADALIAWTSFYGGLTKDLLAEAARKLHEAQHSGSLIDEENAIAEQRAKLLELLSLLPAVGGDRPRLLIKMDLDQYLAGSGQAELLETGAHLSQAVSRAVSCDSEIATIIYGQDQQPLSLGRSKRLFEKDLRIALVARDRGCSFPGCDMPAILSEGHHILPWRDGGPTDLTNAALECPFHHHRVEPNPDLPEDLQWKIYLDEETGYPIYIPPRDVDPEQRPQIHYRYLALSPSLRRRFRRVEVTPGSIVGAYGQAIEEAETSTPGQPAQTRAPNSLNRTSAPSGFKDANPLTGFDGTGAPSRPKQTSKSMDEVAAFIRAQIAQREREHPRVKTQPDGDEAWLPNDWGANRHSDDGTALHDDAHLLQHLINEGLVPHVPLGEEWWGPVDRFGGMDPRSLGPDRHGRRPAPYISATPLRPIKPPPKHDHDCELDYANDGTWTCHTQLRLNQLHGPWGPEPG